MKAKLVKYPYDKKKYRWDNWYQVKEFEYFWDESLPNNFETIEPYIKTETIDYTNNKYGFLLNKPFNTLSYDSETLYNYKPTKKITTLKYYPSFTENGEITRWATGYKLGSSKTYDGKMEGIYYVIRHDTGKTFNIYFFKNRETAVNMGFTNIGYIADTTGVDWANYGLIPDTRYEFYQAPYFEFELYNNKYYPTIYLTMPKEGSVNTQVFKYKYRATYCPFSPHSLSDVPGAHVYTGINTDPLYTYTRYYNNINLDALAGLIGFYSLAKEDTAKYGSHPDYAYFRNYMLNILNMPNGYEIDSHLLIDEIYYQNENSVKLKIVYDEGGLSWYSGATLERYDFSWDSANIPGINTTNPQYSP